MSQVGLIFDQIEGKRIIKITNQLFNTIFSISNQYSKFAFWSILVLKYSVIMLNINRKIDNKEAK